MPLDLAAQFSVPVRQGEQIVVSTLKDYLQIQTNVAKQRPYAAGSGLGTAVENASAGSG